MNPAELTSADAVEVAAFCWPKDDPQQAWRELLDREAVSPNGYETDTWGFRTFDDLHRAAAVLVKRGLAEGLNRNLIGKWDRTRDAGPHTNDFMAWLLSAPADAWARAILATVREVRG